MGFVGRRAIMCEQNHFAGMKGQKLFVRRVESNDRDSIETLYRSAKIRQAPPVDRGFIGKLVGDTVAHVATHREEDSEIIVFVFVDPRMRRKRVGQVMFAEVEAALRNEGLRRIVIASNCVAEGFFTRIGFKMRGGRIEKDVD